MTDLREQLQRAWTERRDGETRAMMASAKDKPDLRHAWLDDGKCPLCGVVGRHSDMPPNPCCGNTGTHGENGRNYCSTCGQELP